MFRPFWTHACIKINFLKKLGDKSLQKEWISAKFHRNEVLTFGIPIVSRIWTFSLISSSSVHCMDTSISSRVFHQIVGFSGEIVPYQELFFVVAPASSVQRRRKRGNYWSNRLRPRPLYLSGYFLIRNFFFPDLKISTFTRISVFKSNLPVHMYPQLL